MRKIIDGRTYNTATSKLVGEWSNGENTSDFNYCEEYLYINTKGAYFIHGAGGGYSKYATIVGHNRGWGERIIPLTLIEAQDWAEERLDADEYEKEFGGVEEASGDLTTRERVNLVLDSEIIENFRKLSLKTGTPMSRMADEAIMETYGEQFKKL